jgi:hypothetical protein
MRVEQRFNKQSPTQSRFWGRSISKLNPERVVEIPKQIFLVQNSMADLMAQIPVFISYRSGDIRERKTVKIGKTKIRPPTLHRFSRSTG